MQVLISGAGIAGPTLAFWLRRAGYTPTLVERSPSLRTGGYIIDFWGAGVEVAERMGLWPSLKAKGYSVEEVRMVDREGKRVGGFSAEVFERFTQGRFTSLPRGALAASLYEALEGQVETLFDEGITALEHGGRKVRVSFRRSAPRDFDLVVGADGLHSRVRSLMFGPEARFERYLGYQVAAFETTGYRPRDERAYVIHTEPSQQVARYSMRADRTVFLFVLAAEEPSAPDTPAAQKALLRRRFAGSGWECPAILEALDAAPELYFDRVSQVRMERWTSGRVALVGDAASCVSLLAGQGSALAMVAAYVLAGELKAAGGDHVTAFARYHQRLAPFIADKQRSAQSFAGSFAPRTRLGLFFRNQVTRLLSLPGVAELAIGPGLRDRLELPDYGFTSPS